MAVLSDYLNNRLQNILSEEKEIERIKEKQLNFQTDIENEINDLKEQDTEITDTIDVLMTEIIPSLQEVE